jgi:preprotein translocase subunit SecA
LTAALAATLAASSGVPVHVVTVNDYLAQRDAEEMSELYVRAGLTVGSIITGLSPDERRRQYGCHITYCTGKELVFDYLKDRSSFGSDVSEKRHQLSQWVNEGATDRPLLRGLHFAIVDEADSIFIDEARTPLILAVKIGPGANDSHFSKALALAAQLEEGRHYLKDHRLRSVHLTVIGRQHITQASLSLGGEWGVRLAREHWVVQALRAQHLFLRDQHYVVRENKVEIVDENTGRVLPGRTWEQGLHQMIETKECCEMSDRAQTLARITYQRFFARYLRLSGMTGTAKEVRREIRKAYRLRTLIVPTYRNCQRVRLQGAVTRDSDAKWQLIASRIESLVRQGRAVLAGTRSVQASEELSAVLRERGIAHRILNAREDAEEAALVSTAGEAGTVTVATNMAGRGTDIKLPSQVLACGGLHVVLSEHHESSRVDRQLFGRSARQGDAGSVEAIVAFDDDLFVQFAPALARIAASAPQGWPRKILLRLTLAYAQRRAESQHRRARAEAVRVDDQLTEMMSLSGRL